MSEANAGVVLVPRTVSDAEAFIAGKAILDAHGQWELENNRKGGANPWQRAHLILLGRAALSAAPSAPVEGWRPDREAVARLLCEQRNLDPDEHIIGGQATNFEDFGPRWKAARHGHWHGFHDYEADADAILALSRAPVGEEG